MRQNWRLSQNTLAIGNRYFSHDVLRMPLEPANQNQLSQLGRGAHFTNLEQWVEVVDAEDEGSVEVDFEFHDAMLRPVQFKDLEVLRHEFGTAAAFG